MPLPPPDLACPDSGCVEAAEASCARGVLRLRGTGTPLPERPLRVGERQLATDGEGRFEVCGLPSEGAPVELLDPSLALATSALLPGELTLWAATADVAQSVGTYLSAPKGPTTQSLSLEEIQRSPGALGDPVRAARALPGVARPPQNTGWILVRGGRPGDTAVLVDGLPVDGLLHLAGFASAVHPGVVKELQLVPTAPRPHLATRSAGVLAVDLARPAEQPGLWTELTPAWVALSTAPTAGPLEMSLAGRTSYAGALLSGLMGRDVRDVVPRFSDLSLQAAAGPVDLLALGLVDRASLPRDDGSAATLLQHTEHIAAHYGTDHADAWLAGDQHVLSVDERFFLGVTGPTAQLLARPEGPLHPELGLTAGSQRHTLHFDDFVAERGLHQASASLGLSGGDELVLDLGTRLLAWAASDAPPRARVGASLAASHPLGRALTLRAEAARAPQLPASEVLLVTPTGQTPSPTVADLGAVGAVANRRGVQSAVDVWIRHDKREILENDSLAVLERQLAGLDAYLVAHRGGASLSLRGQLTTSLGTSPDPLSQPVLWEIACTVPIRSTWLASGRLSWASGALAPPNQTEVIDLLQGVWRPLERTPGGRLPATSSLDLRLSHRRTLRRGWLDLALDVQNAYSRRVPEPVLIGYAPLDGELTYGLPALPLLVLTRSTPSRQARDAATSSR